MRASLRQPWIAFTWLAIGITFLAIADFSLGQSSTVSVESKEHFNVGYTVLDFKHHVKGVQKTLTVAVWYPTKAQPKPFSYGGAVKGSVAVDGDPFEGRGPYPLMVFAHGYSGSGTSHVFLTEPLAARGWIVVAPDFSDRHSGVRIRAGLVKDVDRLSLLRHAKEITRSSPDDRDAYLYRLDEMELALDEILKSQEFGTVIDRNKIAVGGHSFGGFTALGLCGTIRERLDKRIKAVLLYSTGAAGYLFREQELAKIKIPSMYFLGEFEKSERRGGKTMAELADKVYRNLSPPKYFVEIKGGEHGSFNNWVRRGLGSYFLGGNDAQFEVIRRYSIAFLEQHAARRRDLDHVLESQDARLTRYVRELSRDQTP